MVALDPDQQISASRQSLAAYREATQPISVDSLLLVAREVATLEALAMAYPSKAARVAALINDWLSYMDTLKSRLT